MYKLQGHHSDEKNDAQDINNVAWTLSTPFTYLSTMFNC